MKFPIEIQDAIKECILNVIWPKEDIIAFLKKHGCTKEDLVPVRKHSDLTRNKIVYLVFKKLESDNDGGYAKFISMNRALLNWTSFNKHYFEKLNKLNIEDAEKALAELKELQYYLN